MKPDPVFLKPGDVMNLGIQGLGEQRQDVVAQTEPVLAFANHEEVDNWRRAQQLGVTKIVSRNEFSSRTLQLVQEVVGACDGPPPAQMGQA